MAGSTTNFGLTKPIGTEQALISTINGNMDIIDSVMEAEAAGMAIVANGNTHVAIAAGQFVFVKNHGTLTTGLYIANSAIAANATLSSSNLTADTSGGLNSLSDQIGTQWEVDSVDEVTFGTGATAINSPTDTVKAILYKNGVKRVRGALSINSSFPSGGTVFTVPSKYSPSWSKNGDMQLWLMIGDRIVLASSTYFTVWSGKIPEGYYGIDFMYL